MKWKFWKKHDVENEHAKLHSKLEVLNTEMDDLKGDILNISEQITKLIRFQFKTSKDIEQKIDQFENTIHTREHEENRKKELLLMESIIRLVDEIDHVCSGIRDQNVTWFQLLTQWSNEMLNQLKLMDVFELDVLGKSFDPSIAESVEVVHKETLIYSPIVPYQVVEVIKRGFVDKDGRIIRKAQIISVKEEL